MKSEKAIRKELKKDRKSYNSNVEAIKENDDLTPQAKRRKLDKVHANFVEKQNNAWDKVKEHRAKQKEKLEDSVFSIDTDNVADRLAVDEATHKFKSASKKERKSRLNSAGKETSKAIVKAAYETGDVSTMRKYAEKYPETSDKVDQLAESISPRKDQSGLDWAFTKPMKPRV